MSCDKPSTKLDMVQLAKNIERVPNAYMNQKVEPLCTWMEVDLPRICTAQTVIPNAKSVFMVFRISMPMRLIIETSNDLYASNKTKKMR